MGDCVGLSMEIDLSPFVQDAAAAEVLRWMREGRWRKARDAAKDLCKRDRGTYLPLLIESNTGLVREMLGKGLTKDATTVVDHLASFAPAEWIAKLRAEIAAPVVRQPASSVSTAMPSKGIDGWSAAMTADAAWHAGKEPSALDLALIDLLVTDSFVPSVAEGGGRARDLADELAMVRRACDATGAGRWEEARDALRTLPRNSVFRHWRMFLRGVRCVFENERATAAQCFGTLPPAGALARAARAFDAALLPAGPAAPGGALVPFYLATTGQPAAWADPILKAASSWKAGDRVKAFEDLQMGIKNGFPTNRPGLPALLTDAVLPFRKRMTDEDFDDVDDLVQICGVEGAKKRPRNPDSMLAVMQPLCVVDCHAVPARELEKSWREVIKLWTLDEGPDPVRDSVAWHWLGEMVGNPAALPPSIRGDFDEWDKDPVVALRALENAVDCDPENEDAWLSLLGLLGRTGDSKRRVRLLNDLAKRFPGNKAILLQAGSEAVERKSYDKGLALLRSASALDPLDKKVKSQIMVALVSQTRELLRKGRPVAGQWLEMEPFLEDRPPPEYFMLSRWMSRVRQVLLEPDSESAARARADAERLAPSALERLFFEDSLAAVYGIKLRNEWKPEWSSARDAGRFDWSIVCRLLEINAFVAQIRGWGWKQTQRALSQVLPTIEILTTKRLKDDPEGLLAFVDGADALRKGMTEHASYVFDICMRDLVDAMDRFVPPGKKTLDPRLRLASLILLERSGAYDFGRESRFLKDLESVADTARKLGMTGIVTRCQALRERHERGPSAGRSFMGPDDDWGDGPDDESEESPFGTGQGQPSMDAAVKSLIAMLDKASRGNDHLSVGIARASLRALGITDDQIDAALKELSGAAGPPPKPGRSKPKSKPKPAPPVDPNQPDLF